jgi:hypothetical protein
MEGRARAAICWTRDEGPWDVIGASGAARRASALVSAHCATRSPAWFCTGTLPVRAKGRPLGDAAEIVSEMQTAGGALGEGMTVPARGTTVVHLFGGGAAPALAQHDGCSTFPRGTSS